MVVSLTQSTPFLVQAIPKASQANPEVTFHGQWLAKKISDNIDSLIEIGLSVRGTVTHNYSANANAFSALKNIQFRNKLYKVPTKRQQNILILWDCSSYEKHQKYVICFSASYICWVDLYNMASNLRKSPKLSFQHYTLEMTNRMYHQHSKQRLLQPEVTFQIEKMLPIFWKFLTLGGQFLTLSKGFHQI